MKSKNLHKLKIYIQKDIAKVDIEHYQPSFVKEWLTNLSQGSLS